jgi:hypothetical protein
MIANVDTASVPVSEIVADNPDKAVEEKREYVYRVFLAIEKTMYFVNHEDMVFTEVDGRTKNVGLKKESNKPGFDWIFVKDGDSYGVDKKGKLWAFSTDGNFHVVGQAIKLNL